MSSIYDIHFYKKGLQMEDKTIKLENQNEQETFMTCENLYNDCNASIKKEETDERTSNDMFKQEIQEEGMFVKREEDNDDPIVFHNVDFEKITVKQEMCIELIREDESNSFEEENQPELPQKDARKDVLKKFQCFMCNINVQYKSRLKQHIEKVHLKLKNKSRCGNGDLKPADERNSSNCKSSKRSNSTNFKFKLDPTTSVEVQSVPNVQSFDKAGRQQFPRQRAQKVACNCPNCRQGVKSSDGKKIHVCHVTGCVKSYVKISHLRSHIRWHTGDRPYNCNWPFCDKKFLRSDELQRHKRTHTGEKKHECFECKKKFTRSDHLSKHLKIHQKIAKNRLRCNECNKEFTRSHFLENHLKKHKKHGVSQGTDDCRESKWLTDDECNETSDEFHHQSDPLQDSGSSLDSSSIEVGRMLMMSSFLPDPLSG